MEANEMRFYKSLYPTFTTTIESVLMHVEFDSVVHRDDVLVITINDAETYILYDQADGNAILG